MINLIILAILIIPFVIIPINGIPEPTRLIKEVLFDFVMMGLIVIGLRNGLKFEYKNKALALLAAWGFFQIGFNWYYPLIRGYGYNAGTIIESVHFLLAIVATILFCSSVDKSGFVRISKAIVFSGTAVAIFGIFQGIGLDPMMKIATHKVIPGSNDTRYMAALLDHPNLFGNYIALCLPFCLYLRGIKYKVCFGIIATALIMAQSSLSVVAAVIGTAVFILLKYRNKITLLSVSGALIAFGAFCALVPKFNKLSNGFTGRIDVWHEFISKSVNPIFGNGFGVPKSYGVVRGSQFWSTPHNDYITIWLSLGYVGLFLVGLIIFKSLIQFSYVKSNTLGFAYLASLATFLILMFGSFPLESAPIALIGLVCFWGIEKGATWKNS